MAVLCFVNVKLAVFECLKYTKTDAWRQNKFQKDVFGVIHEGNDTYNRKDFVVSCIIKKLQPQRVLVKHVFYILQFSHSLKT